MWILRKIGSFIRFFDLYASTAKLFYNSEEVSSVLGGIVCIIALTASAIFFYPTFMQFLTFENNRQSRMFHCISTTFLTCPQAPYFFNTGKDLMTLCFNNGKQKLFMTVLRNLRLSNAILRNGVYEETKNFQEWTWCAPPELNMTIYGRYTTNHSRLVVLLRRCYDEDCLTDEQFAELPPFFVVMTFPELTVRVQQTNYSYYTLNDNLWFNIYPAQTTKKYNYQMLMDEVQVNDKNVNVWPENLAFFAQQKNVSTQLQLYSFYQTEFYYYDADISFTIMKLPKRTIINRKIIKIDQLISYLGGFLSIFLPFADFISSSYNERLMLLKTGSKIQFENQNDVEPPDPPLEKDYNILQSLKIGLFGNCQQPKSKGSYSEKALLVIRQMEQKLSINNLLERLARCQVQITRISGYSDWLKKQIIVKASQLQQKKYQQQQDEEPQKTRNQIQDSSHLMPSLEFSSINLLDKLFIIQNPVTGLCWSPDIFTIKLQSYTEIKKPSWQIQRTGDQVVISHNGAVTFAESWEVGGQISIGNIQSSSRMFQWTLQEIGEGKVQIKLNVNRALSVRQNKLIIQESNPNDHRQYWKLF